MKRANGWRLAQGFGASLLIAAAFVVAGVPYNYCQSCMVGEWPYWVCVLNGCWIWM